MSKFEELKASYLQAVKAADWNGVVNYATQMLQIEDNHAWLWANRGIGLQRLGCYLDAILNYDRALQIEQSPLFYHNKGSAYYDLEQTGPAMKWLNMALTLDPNLAETHMNMGHIYKWQGNLELAIGAYRKSVAAKPDYADGHMALGMTLLKAGKLKEGWTEFEWRWKTDQLPPRNPPAPQWRGEDLSGRSILVYGEQGLGDIIQFARYARVLTKQFPGCKVVIEGRHAVKRLLQRIPEVEVINFGETVPQVDYAVPMLTLAGLLTPSISVIPAREEQFKLVQADVETWARRMAPIPAGLRVGVCWAGMSRSHNPMAERVDGLRSTTLADFGPLAKVPGVVWVSLQKGPPAEQVKRPPTGMTIADFTEDMHDFYETCCAIANCDIVISVDTAVLHAAASIGKPTWLLSRWDGCWRWFGDRSDSPWYPTLRQFVQPAPHDWQGMMQEVAKELEGLVSDNSQGQLDLTMA